MPAHRGARDGEARRKRVHLPIPHLGGQAGRADVAGGIHAAQVECERAFQPGGHTRTPPGQINAVAGLRQGCRLPAGLGECRHFQRQECARVNADVVQLAAPVAQAGGLRGQRPRQIRRVTEGGMLQRLAALARLRVEGEALLPGDARRRRDVRDLERGRFANHICRVDSDGDVGRGSGRSLVDLRPVQRDRVFAHTAGRQRELREGDAGCRRRRAAPDVELRTASRTPSRKRGRGQPLDAVHIEAVGRPVEGGGHVVPGVFRQHAAHAQRRRLHAVAEAGLQAGAVHHLEIGGGVDRAGVGVAAEDGIGARVRRGGIDPRRQAEVRARAQARVRFKRNVVVHAVEGQAEAAHRAGRRLVVGVCAGVERAVVLPAGGVGQAAAIHRPRLVHREVQRGVAAEVELLAERVGGQGAVEHPHIVNHAGKEVIFAI